MDASCMQAIMRDPVVTQDGHSYERSAIEQWYRKNSTSPMTGVAVGDMRVQVPSRGLRAIAALYRRYTA
jgi:U-box domain